MNNKIDRYIFRRLLSISLFFLFVLVIIYIILDFSQNSENFTDNGATLSVVFSQYYLNYIPEMARLVMPVAVFVACLYLTAQMAERLEIVALKATGVSIYRLAVPYLVFAFLAACVISYLDGYVIPEANAGRYQFEMKYLPGRSSQVDTNQIYRQESADRIFKIEYYDPQDSVALQSRVFTFDGDSIRETWYIPRMEWVHSREQWFMTDVRKETYSPTGFVRETIDTLHMRLNIYPRDLARRSSDIYQLTYPEAADYLAAIERSGTSGNSNPQIQFFGRLFYPFSIPIVTLIGFSFASERRKGGKGFYIAAGLGISFVYLVLMKVMEPFGSEGEIAPPLAVLIPHLSFLLVGIILLATAKK